MNLGRAPFLPHRIREHWKWHTCHKYDSSFDAFSTYHLIDKIGTQVGHRFEASFCLEDTDCLPYGTRVYGCYGQYQGISANCLVTYARSLDCQWVDLTDIAYGKYKLVIAVNPHRRVAETDFSNNAIYCDFTYLSQWGKVELGDCGLYTDWKSLL
jgi:lysyl oxidase-like protein 2/3/4